MYNEEIKKEFIANYNIIVNGSYIENIFNCCERSEKYLGKDVFNFIREEILDLFVSMNSSSIKTLSARATILRAYTSWACQNQISKDNINHFTEVDIYDLEKCINPYFKERQFISREELLNSLNLIESVSDRFIFLALFEGIKGKDCCEFEDIKMSDFDVKNKTLRLNTGRVINVSDELIEIARESSKIYEEGYYMQSGTRFMPIKYVGEGVIKFRDNSSAFNISAKVIRAVKNKNNIGLETMSIPKIMNSGAMHMASNIAKENNILITDLFRYPELCNKIIKQYGKYKGGGVLRSLCIQFARYCEYVGK